MGKSKFTSKGPGLDPLRRAFDKANGAGVKVGILESAGMHGSDGVTVAEVAAWNEYGTSTIPPRPALRNAINDNEKAIGDALERTAEDAVDGKPLATGLGQVGLRVQAMMRTSITELRSPPNAQSTVAAKGSSNPLIEDGLYRRSINFEVVIPSGGAK